MEKKGNKEMKVLFYCTCIKKLNLNEYVKLHKETNGWIDKWNQKIVCECEIDKVEEIRMLQDNNMTYETKTLTEEQLLIKSCLEGYQLGNYLGYLYENEYGYALHLSNVKVLDKPYDLNEWFNKNEKPLVKAPQNMCHCYHWLGDEYILISIQPQHLVNILNGKKTIEIRKQILNVMKEKLC